jgi:hypothetical protein
MPFKYFSKTFHIDFFFPEMDIHLTKDRGLPLHALVNSWFDPGDLKVGARGL